MIYTTIIWDILKRTNLTTNEYIVADIIDKLSNNRGHPWCVVTQEYFAEHLGVDVKTVSRILKRLVDDGYVNNKSRSERKTTDKWREMFITEPDKLSDGTAKPTRQIVQSNQTKSPDEPDKLSDVHIYNINKDNTTPEVEYTLPLNMGKSPMQRLASLYGLLFKKATGTNMTMNYGQVGSMLNRLLKSDKEIVIASLMLAYFNYHPADEERNWLAKTAKASAYGFGLFCTNLNPLKVYLVKEKGQSLDELDKLKELLSIYIESLTNN